MLNFGIAIYLILLVLVIMFLLKRAGRSLDQLIGDGGHKHHHVHRVIAKHPKGGSWSQHKGWMVEEEEAPTPH